MSLRNIQTGREFSDEMKDNFNKFEKLMDKKLPEKTAVELEKVILESFDQEQYQDGKASKWQSRKEEDAGRKILIGKGSGKLKRSIEVTHTSEEVKASTDVVYAPVHNEGLKAGRGKGFTMPKRQHMPIPGEKNEKLDKIMDKWMDDEMDKIFN